MISRHFHIQNMRGTESTSLTGPAGLRDFLRILEMCWRIGVKTAANEQMLVASRRRVEGRLMVELTPSRGDGGAGRGAVR